MNHVNKLCMSLKSEYYCKKIGEAGTDQKELYIIANDLLHNKKETVLPTHDSSTDPEHFPFRRRKGLHAENRKSKNNARKNGEVLTNKRIGSSKDDIERELQIMCTGSNTDITVERCSTTYAANTLQDQ